MMNKWRHYYLVLESVENALLLFVECLHLLFYRYLCGNLIILGILFVWSFLLFLQVGTITLLTLTGVLVFLLFLAAATVNAIILSLFMSLAAAGGFLAIFFACMAGIYIGALSLAALVISLVTISAVITTLIVTGKPFEPSFSLTFCTGAVYVEYFDNIGRWTTTLLIVRGSGSSVMLWLLIIFDL